MKRSRMEEEKEKEKDNIGIEKSLSRTRTKFQARASGCRGRRHPVLLGEVGTAHFADIYSTLLRNAIIINNRLFTRTVRKRNNDIGPKT